MEIHMTTVPRLNSTFRYHTALNADRTRRDRAERLFDRQPGRTVATAATATAAESDARLADERRRRDLARLIGMWPHDLVDQSVPKRRRIIEKLRLALLAERRRATRRDWSYDLARHAALARAYKDELAALEAELAPGAMRPTRR